MVNTHSYKAGDIIIKENDTGETAFIVKRGRVRISKETEGKTIPICDLEAGSIFGEMSMIDDKPRSATVTAIEDTVVHEIHRNNFFAGLKNEQELALKILKILFERLRKANTAIAKLKASDLKPAKFLDCSLGHVSLKPNIEVFMEGLTRRAVQNLPENPFHIKKFPFLIGRKSRDPLAFNDLSISDRKPYRISRHHIELDKLEDRIFIFDRGSHLGSVVNGCQLGGPKGKPGPVIFKEKEGTLILGNEHSPYRYKVLINAS